MCEELGVSCSAVIGFCMAGKSRSEPGQGVGLVLTLGDCRAGWAVFPTALLQQVGSEQTAKQLCIVHPDFNRYDYLLQFYWNESPQLTRRFIDDVCQSMHIIKFANFTNFAKKIQ